MVKLVALFKKPSDTKTFEEHYDNIHIPLVGKMPGMRRLETSLITGAPMSTTEFYRMAEMYFDDQRALNTAMMSVEGMSAAKDLMTFAKGLAQLFFAEVKE